MIDKINDPEVCRECGSKKVQSKAWAEINTKKVIEFMPEPMIKDNWCPNCETHCMTMPQSDYRLMKTGKEQL